MLCLTPMHNRQYSTALLQGGTFILSAFGVVVSWDIDLLGNQGRWIFTIIGVSVLLYVYDVPKRLLLQLWRRETKLVDLIYPRATWNEKIFGSSTVKEGKLMPLSKAASKLYEAARQGRIPMAGAETLSGGAWPNIQPGSPEEILNGWAIRIAESDIALYGRRPPSNLLERISSLDRKKFIFKDGATIFHHPANDTSYYCDLSVKQQEFEEHYDIQAG